VAWFSFKLIYGHDHTIVLLMMTAYFNFLLRRRFSAGWFVVDGILLGLLFLARVDSIVLVFASYCVTLGYAIFQVKSLKPVIASMTLAAAIVAPYMAWGYVHFGTWMPVSATLKSTFPVPNLGESVDLYIHGSIGVSGKLFIPLAFVMSVWH
jgi:hypothetical protein